MLRLASQGLRALETNGGNVALLGLRTMAYQGSIITPGADIKDVPEVGARCEGLLEDSHTDHRFDLFFSSSHYRAVLLRILPFPHSPNQPPTYDM